MSNDDLPDRLRAYADHIDDRSARQSAAGVPGPEALIREAADRLDAAEAVCDALSDMMDGETASETSDRDKVLVLLKRWKERDAGGGDDG